MAKSPIKRVFFRLFASIAQLVEQLICNQQVIGSNPIAGSIKKPRKTPVLLGFLPFFSVCPLFSVFFRCPSIPPVSPLFRGILDTLWTHPPLRMLGVLGDLEHGMIEVGIRLPLKPPVRSGLAIASLPDVNGPF